MQGDVRKALERRKDLIDAARLSEREGQLAEAEGYCRALLAADLADQDATLILGRVAMKSGRSQLAQSLFDNVLTRDPSHLETLIEKARLSRSVGRPDEGVMLATRAIDAHPASAEAYFLLAVCLIDEWRNVNAIDALRRAIELDPGFANAYDRLGFALGREGRADEAETAYRRAIKLLPTKPNSYVNLGSLLAANGRSDDATIAFVQALETAKNSVTHLFDLSRALSAVGQVHAAAHALELAVELDPQSADGWLKLGAARADLGDFAAALDAYRRAVRRAPERVRPYYDLAFCARQQEADRPIVDALERLLARGNLSPEEQVQAHFALGKCKDDFGEYEQAMDHFRRAHRAARLLPDATPFDRDGFASLIDRLIETFQPTFFNARRSMGLSSEAPIFVVGMIRSGTTLVEQIVSSHPDVAAAGELKYLAVHGARLLSSDAPFRTGDVQALATGYLARLKSCAPTSPRVVDKMPDNYVLAGLIHVMFPEARIILCRRNALDNCLSIYTTPVVAEYTQTPEDIMFAYRQCQRLTDHWQRVLPKNRFKIVDYEALVSDPASIEHSLIDFLGIPWSDAVLRHEANHRVINTPSRWQAKQPIYKSSLERWRRYEPWLGAFRELLEEAA